MGKILFFGEPLIRITPTEWGMMRDNTTASVHYGGSEINVACALQGFGLQTRLLSALPNNNLGDSYLSFLKQHALDTSNIFRIGERIGIYYLEDGFGCRHGQISYDRTHTSISEIKPDMLDFEKLFEDVSHFHFSGITIAISESCRLLLELLLLEAKKRGVVVSFDPNLRKHMIALQDAKQEFSYFAAYADVCFGIEPLMLHAQDLTLFDRENATTSMLIERMQQLKEHFHFKAIFHTIRTIDSAGVNSYQAFAFDGALHSSKLFQTKTLQRIGSGDAFVAGALYKLINGMGTDEIVDFAAACASLKCTIAGDHLNQPVSRVNELLSKQKDVSR